MALVYAGIPPADVLIAATINGARALGVDKRLGTIEAGQVYRPGELLDGAVGKIGLRRPDDHADWILEVPALRD